MYGTFISRNAHDSGSDNSFTGLSGHPHQVVIKTPVVDYVVGFEL